jgi:hypothetical protein
MFACSCSQSLTCGMCGESVGSARANENRQLVALFGAAAFASCPVCGAETNPRDRVWRQKVRRWVKRQRRAHESSTAI